MAFGDPAAAGGSTSDNADGGGPKGSAGQSGVSVGVATSPSEFNDDAGMGGAAPPGSSASPAGFAADNRGLFGGIADFFSENPQSLLGLTIPGFGLVTAVPTIAKALGFELGPPGPVGPGPEGDGPITPTVGEIQQATGPAFNPIEDLVGSEYVAYDGMKADEIRQKLFPYMNFNQPTQPGIQGLIGEYAGVGKGTGLMTGPFGMSNTQV